MQDCPPFQTHTHTIPSQSDEHKHTLNLKAQWMVSMWDAGVGGWSALSDFLEGHILEGENDDVMQSFARASQDGKEYCDSQLCIYG